MALVFLYFAPALTNSFIPFFIQFQIKIQEPREIYVRDEWVGLLDDMHTYKYNFLCSNYAQNRICTKKGRKNNEKEEEEEEMVEVDRYNNCKLYFYR